MLNDIFSPEKFTKSPLNLRGSNSSIPGGMLKDNLEFPHNYRESRNNNNNNNNSDLSGNSINSNAHHHHHNYLTN